MRLTIGLGNKATMGASARGIALFFSRNQLLKIINQVFKLVNIKILIARAVTMTYRPKFQVLNKVIALYTIFVVNRFRWQQISPQMCFHSQPMLLDIAILGCGMIGIPNHNITTRSLEASTFPLRASTTFPLFWNKNGSNTGFAISRQRSFTQSTTDFSYCYSLNRMTFGTGASNSHTPFIASWNIFYILRQIIKDISEGFWQLTRIKWSPILWVGLHCITSIPNNLPSVNILERREHQFIPSPEGRGFLGAIL